MARPRLEPLRARPARRASGRRPARDVLCIDARPPVGAVRAPVSCDDDQIRSRPPGIVADGRHRIARQFDHTGAHSRSVERVHQLAHATLDPTFSERHRDKDSRKPVGGRAIAIREDRLDTNVRARVREPAPIFRFARTRPGRGSNRDSSLRSFDFDSTQAVLMTSRLSCDSGHYTAQRMRASFVIRNASVPSSNGGTTQFATIHERGALPMGRSSTPYGLIASTFRVS